MLEVNFDPFPEITTDKLLLRKIVETDADILFRLRFNTTVMRYIDRPMAQDVNDVILLIDKVNESLINNEGITWAICLRNESSMIGTIGFWRFDFPNHRTEIGYMLLPEYHRQGIMDEAIKAIIHYGFKTLKIHSIEANVNIANTASKKILEKHHFVKEAHFRENYYYNGVFLDSIIYCLLESDYFS
ncbi:MAG: GNAT family N-acetyltransferase [Saprospiraceae bacterium]